ncbi:hypothetical protein DFH09DRAFT_941221, partial [Mycena vulgaris]
QEFLGEDHPETLMAMNDLAVPYLDSGRPSAAEELLVAAAGKQRKVWGEEHPDTLCTLGNLALTYDKKGQFKRAEELYVTVLEKQRKSLGNDHRAPDEPLVRLPGRTELRIKYER